MDIVALVERGPLVVRRSGHGGSSDFPIESLTASAAEAQQTQSEQDTDDNKTDDDERAGHGARVVEEGVGTTTAAT